MEVAQPSDQAADLNLAQATTQITGVRVETEGEGPPTVNVSTGAAGLVLGIAPGLGLASGNDDAIRIGVTGEGDQGYAPRNATSATRIDTPLRDIPRTIQIIPEQVLEDQGITRVTDAVRNQFRLLLTDWRVNAQP